jgi:imidazolonepropionase-like amidohydrolase
MKAFAMMRLNVAAVLLSHAALPAAAQQLAVTDAKAYLVPGKPATEDATILIDGGKVTAAGAGLRVPAGFKVIDAKGAIVTPGLMNSNSKLALTETGGAENTDAAVTTGPFGEAFDPEYALNANSTVIPIVRSDGLTRAASLPTGSAAAPFTGEATILVLNEGSEILDKPQAAVVAHIGGMVVNASGGSRAAAWQLVRAALDSAGAKRTIDSSPATAPNNTAALKSVLDGKTPLVIVASRESDLRQAVALVDVYKIRVVLVGAEEGWRIAPLLASHHIDVVVDPYLDSPSNYDAIGTRLDSAAILDKAGVNVSFEGTFVHVTYNAGIVIREGAGIAVANGMNWDHALRALTSGPAATWGIGDHYGTLEPGKDADLVVWDGDPLEPMTNPVTVVVKGKVVSLDNRQRMLERRYAPANVDSKIPAAYR